MLYLMFGQLDFNLVRLIRDFQLRVQPALCFLQPVCQLPPGLMKLDEKIANIRDGERYDQSKRQSEVIQTVPVWLSCGPRQDGVLCLVISAQVCPSVPVH